MSELTKKQKVFCREYVIDWNATRAAKAAGYSFRSASSIGHENLTKPEIKDYIKEIQKDIAKLAGVSALRNQLELAKLAYSSISTFKEDWLTQKEFENLTEGQRACISEIVTIERQDRQGKPITIIKFKLHDKIKAIQTLNQMNGWNAPDKVDHTSKGEKLEITPVMFFSTNEGA